MDNNQSSYLEFGSGAVFPYQQPARIISVFSPRGGVGKTTLAVNLAAALSQIWKIKTGLLDLAFTTGHCSLMLDLKPRGTLAALSEYAGPISTEVVEEILYNHESGVELLPGADSPMEGELVTPGLFELVWPFLYTRYPIIVVDAGSSFNEITLAMLDRSDMILLLFTPELASVKSTTDSLQLFKEFGYVSGKVQPVANWTFPAAPLLLSRIIQKLEVSLFGEVPYDSSGFIQAVNTGRPPVITAPNSPAAWAIYQLAYKISAADMKAMNIKSDSPLLKKLQG
jgi:pilus assembly protein CpaE